MRRSYWLIFIIFLSFNLIADISIEYDSALSDENIITTNINEVDYFNVYEFDKSFKAVISEDILDRRLYVNIYGKQMVFLVDSSYLLFGNDIYNFIEPVIQEEGKYFLPVSFLVNILPEIYDSITFKDGKLFAHTPVDNRIETIVIDPGHGGKDPGAISYTKSNFEKDIVLSVSKKLQKKLKDKMDVEVLLTRNSDKFVSLHDRTKFANQNNADLFVSIHCNAHYSSKAHGVEVYYLSSAKTDEARAVEALENQVVYDYEGGEEAVKKYDDLAFILADMAQSEHLEESYDLSSKFQDKLVHTTNSFDRGVKQANFFVLRGAFMPAVLVELGFMTNKKEEKKLTNSTYQEKLVESLFLALKDFKLKYEIMQ